MNTKSKSLSLRQLIMIAVLTLGVLFALVRSAMTVQIPTTAPVQMSQFNQGNTVSKRWNEEAAREVERVTETFIATDNRNDARVAGSIEDGGLAQELTPEVILSYVAEIRLDSDGKIVLDDRTLTYLRSSLHQITSDLTAQDKAYLHRVLSQGIGGSEGVKAADIVINYYDYLTVKKSLLEDAMAGNNLLANSAELSNINSRVEALQYSYFDADVVDQLFYKENMDTRFSYELHALQQDSSMNNEQKRAALDDLKQKYHQTQPPISQWAYKKRLFEQEKAILVQQAAMGQSEDIAPELLAALARHFSERELLIMEDYHVDLINPSDVPEEPLDVLFVDEEDAEPVAASEDKTNSN